MNILEFHDVHITYDRETEAVRGVSFAVPKQSIVSIVGESGSGKSTLIRAALGLLPAEGRVSAGQILFAGRDLCNLSSGEWRSLRGSEMAMIFQDAGSYLNPRVKIGRQFLEMLNAHLDSSKAEKQMLAKEMLAKLKLSDVDRIMKSYPFQLSGGMRQRVAIAMAMSLKPRLLLADEPTSALDVTIQAQVVKELLQLNQETDTSILLVTHNMGVASRVSDYIAVMQGGELMEFGKRDKIIFHPENDYTKKLLEVVPKLESVDVVTRQKDAHRMEYMQLHGMNREEHPTEKES